MRTGKDIELKIIKCFIYFSKYANVSDYDKTYLYFSIYNSGIFFMKKCHDSHINFLYCLQFLNRFDFHLWFQRLKGLKGSQKRPMPKMIMIFFIVFSMFFPLLIMIACACSFYRFRYMRGPKGAYVHLKTNGFNANFKLYLFIRPSLRQDVLWYTTVRPSVSHVTL